MIGPFQISYYFIGTADTPVTLTAAFGGNTSGVYHLGKEMDQMILDISYTPKAGQSDRYMIIRAEFGKTNTKLFQETALKDGSTSGYYINKPFDRIFPDESGTVGGTEYLGRISIPIAEKYGRVSICESGVANFGTSSVLAILTSRSA